MYLGTFGAMYQSRKVFEHNNADFQYWYMYSSTVHECTRYSSTAGYMYVPRYSTSTIRHVHVLVVLG